MAKLRFAVLACALCATVYPAVPSVAGDAGAPFVAGDLQIASAQPADASDGGGPGDDRGYIVGALGDGLIDPNLDAALDDRRMADTGTDLAQNDVNVVGRQMRTAFAVGRVLSLAYLLAIGNASTKVSENGVTTHGSDLRVTQSMIAADIRFTLGAIANIANFANLANFANAGTQDRCYVGLQTAFALGVVATGLKVILHGSSSVDTLIKRRNTLFLLPYMGCTLWYTANHLAFWNLHVGPVFWFHNTRFSTYESPFNNLVSARKFGPSVGGALGTELQYRLPQFLGITAAALTAGAWLGYMPATVLKATSTATAFAYRARVAATWMVLLRLGLVFPF